MGKVFVLESSVNELSELAEPARPKNSREGQRKVSEKRSVVVIGLWHIDGLAEPQLASKNFVLEGHADDKNDRYSTAGFAERINGGADSAVRILFCFCDIVNES